MRINVVKIFCFVGLHNWYYGCFATGERSKYTDDNVGVYGRICLDCRKKQKRENGKYFVVEDWKRD